MSGSMNRYQRLLHIESSERNLIRTGGPEREQFKYSNSEKTSKHNFLHLYSVHKMTALMGWQLLFYQYHIG